MSVKKSEINSYVKKSSNGLNKRQEELFKEKSKQTWFRQYAKKSKEHLIKITRAVKKQAKEYRGEYYNKKGVKDDARGFTPPKKKGATRKEVAVEMDKIRKSMNKSAKNKPVKNKKAIYPKVPKEIREKISKAKTKERRRLYNQRADVKEYNRVRKRKKNV